MKILGIDINLEDYILDNGEDYLLDKKTLDGLFFIDEEEFRYRDEYTEAYKDIKYWNRYNYLTNKDIIDTKQHEKSIPSSFVDFSVRCATDVIS